MSSSANLGQYIRNLRIQANLPLRKLAAALDIDTSTLSKIERNERPVSLSMVPILAQALAVDYKQLQILFISLKIMDEYGQQDFILEALENTIDKLKQPT